MYIRIRGKHALPLLLNFCIPKAGLRPVPLPSTCYIYQHRVNYPMAELSFACEAYNSAPPASARSFKREDIAF